MKKTEKISLTALFAAIGLVLPFLTGQIPVIGKMLLPMHLPVLLCGFICGAPYALPLGALLPVIRSLVFSAPPLYPDAAVMVFELAAYGFFSGFFYSRLKKQSVAGVYLCLAASMLAGRVIWGVAKAVMLGFGGSGFTVSAFLTVGFVQAIPGIVLQLVLIPALMFALDKTRLVPFKR